MSRCRVFPCRVRKELVGWFAHPYGRTDQGKWFNHDQHADAMTWAHQKAREGG